MSDEMIDQLELLCETGSSEEVKLLAKAILNLGGVTKVKQPHDPVGSSTEVNAAGEVIQKHHI